MIQKLDIPVSVVCLFDHKKRVFAPKKVLFEGREYLIEKIGFNHTFRNGRVLNHVFSVVSGSMFFRLEFNSENLNWRLTQIADSEVN